MIKLFKGFTLIELMIAVAIVGILAAIAYPSYLSTVRKTNRAEAKTELFDFAQRLQRCYTAFAKFNDSTNCGAYKELTAAVPPTTRGGFYEIKFATSPAVTATTYRLVATPVSSPQTKDMECSKFFLNQAGVRAAQDYGGADTTSKCW